MDYAEIIATIAKVAGPILGQILAQGDRNTVLKLLNDARDRYGKIQIPQLEKLVAEQAPDSQLGKIRDDPRYRQQQVEADTQLDDVIKSGGLTLTDMAAYNRARAKSNRDESAGRSRIAGDMAARGTLDSGKQLSMQLQNQQQAAQRGSQDAEQLAGRAADRAASAIQMRGNLAGQGLDRDWRQKAQQASAQDAIEQGNTNIRNSVQRYNAGIPQQDFKNQLDLAGAQNSADANIGNFYAGRANDTTQMWGQGSKAFGDGVQATFGEEKPDYDKWAKQWERDHPRK